MENGTKYFVHIHNDKVQMIYREIPVQMNDGTVRTSLQYLSSFSVWMGSNEPSAIKPKLTPISKEEYLTYRGERNDYGTISTQ